MGRTWGNIKVLYICLSFVMHVTRDSSDGKVIKFV